MQICKVTGKRLHTPFCARKYGNDADQYAEQSVDSDEDPIFDAVFARCVVYVEQNSAGNCHNHEQHRAEVQRCREKMS